MSATAPGSTAASACSRSCRWIDELERLFLAEAPSEALRSGSTRRGNEDPAGRCARKGGFRHHQPGRDRPRGAVAPSSQEDTVSESERAPRAIVLVLDSVGAGALPDAAEYGDEGSNTLGNTSRAVGGLKMPVLGSMGLGQHHRHRWRAAHGRAYRLVGPQRRAFGGQGHDHGSLGDDGPRTRARVPDVPGRLPARGDRRVLPADRVCGRARQLGGERDGHHQRARRRAHGHRSADRLHLGGLGVPDRRPRGALRPRQPVRRLRDRAEDACRRALRGSRDRATVRGAGRARCLPAHAPAARLRGEAARAHSARPAARTAASPSSAWARSATSSRGRRSRLRRM